MKKPFQLLLNFAVDSITNQILSTKQRWEAQDQEATNPLQANTVKNCGGRCVIMNG